MSSTNVTSLMLAAGVVMLGSTVMARDGRGEDSEIHRLPAGGVFTMTNDAAGNTVLAFNRAADGSLTADGAYHTGGKGTGIGLGSQGALAITADHHWLLGVNAGTNQVFIFRVEPNKLVLADVVQSGGTTPISVAVNDGLAYVLNSAPPANITGFFIGERGRLYKVRGSTRTLSIADPKPAQVGFTPDGAALVVTEKGTDTIDSFQVDDEGRAINRHQIHSHGSTPFGFSFDSENHLFVSEAFPNTPNGSATSSYAIAEDGSLSLVSPSVTTNHSAACWAVTSPDDRYVYIADAASDVISGYSNSLDGSIALLNPTGVTAHTGSGTKPLDMAISHNGRYFYVLKEVSSGIGAYTIGTDGSLAEVPGIIGLPAGLAGLVAW